MKKIRESSKQVKDKIIKSKPIDMNLNKISFSFQHFMPHSTEINQFHNLYRTERDSRATVFEFIDRLSGISKFEIQEFFSPAVKTNLHYNEFEDGFVIQNIEKILKDGYSFPDKKIEEFEKSYFEFSLVDGKRVIGHRSAYSVFEILFIDCNHLVCRNVSRNIKEKMKYAVRSSFEKYDVANHSEDVKFIEVAKMLLEDYKQNKYTDLAEFMTDYENVFELVK